jgi:hypothetical protein
MLKTIAAHISTGLSVIAFCAGFGSWAFDAYADQVIDKAVTEKLAPLTETIDRQAVQINGFATQQAVQAEQLRILQSSQREANRDIKLILRELRSN